MEWIPVTKRLPKENQTVQVTFLSGLDGKPCCDMFAYIKNGIWYDDYDCDRVKVVITAWKPLCEPYKGEDYDYIK